MMISKKLPKHQRLYNILMKTMLAAIVVGVVSLYSCQKEEINPTTVQTSQSGNNSTSQGGAMGLSQSTGVITVSGIVQQSGITTFQYGTHVLIIPGSPLTYALQSQTFNLDKFVNKFVT